MVETDLYYFEKYKGHYLIVEVVDELDNSYKIYEGCAQFNGTTEFTSRSYISLGSVIRNLKKKVDNSLSRSL